MRPNTETFGTGLPLGWPIQECKTLQVPALNL